MVLSRKRKRKKSEVNWQNFACFIQWVWFTDMNFWLGFDFWLNPNNIYLALCFYSYQASHRHENGLGREMWQKQLFWSLAKQYCSICLSSKKTHKPYKILWSPSAHLPPSHHQSPSDPVPPSFFSLSWMVTDQHAFVCLLCDCLLGVPFPWSPDLGSKVLLAPTWRPHQI